MSTAHQLHYTSCRRGQGGGKGFQTRATSAGVRPDEQREIEARGGYTPPRDLLDEPTREDIERDFPVVFRFYRLSSGRYALTRSQYSGQDYSQRWGNFFAHTLVLDDGAPELWPIDYYEWEGWKGALEPDEDNEEAPPVLPAVVLSGIEPSASFTLTELQAFLRENPGRPGVLSAMVRAVFFGPSRSRVLVVRDTALDGPFWLACVEKAFPLRQAISLPLCTYQFDPRDCAALNATTTGTNFTFADTERNFQFCMFDLAEGTASDIPDDGAEYASTVTRWLAEQPDQLAAFHAFTADVEHDGIGRELAHVLRLFRTSIKDASLSVAAVVEALDGAAALLPASARAKLVAPVADVAEQAAAAGTPEQVISVLRFLADAAERDLMPSARAVIAQTWVRCFVALLSAQRWTGLPALSELRDGLAPDIDRVIAERMLSPTSVAVIGAALAAMPSDAGAQFEWIVAEALRSAQVLNGARPWEHRTMQELVAAVAVRANRDAAVAAALLRAFGDDARGIAFVSAALLSHETPTAAETERRGIVLGRAFFDLFNGAPDPEQAALRRALDAPATWPVLFGEWCAIVAARPGDAACYEMYRDRVLPSLPGYTREYRGSIVRAYAETLEGPRRGAQALTWLRNGDVNVFPRELQEWCVLTAALAVPLARSVNGGLAAAEAVAHRARELGITLDPDRPFLRAALEWIRQPNALASARDLDRLAPMLRRLDDVDYREFLHDFLPPALLNAGSDEQHEAVVGATFVPAARAVFAAVYTAALSANDANALPKAAVTTALRFWLGKNATSPVPFAELNGPALDALTVRLAKLRRPEFEAVQRHFEADRALGPVASTRWRRIKDDIERRNRSIWSRLGAAVRRERP